MTNITNHPTCQHVSALDCVDVAQLAIESIAGLAGLLRQAIVHGAPLGVSELAAVSNTVLRDADRLDAAFALWCRLPADSLPKRLQRSLQRRVDTLRQQADFLGHAAMLAESGTPPTADQLATFASRLLGLTESLHQAVSAAQAASIAPRADQPLH